MRSPTHLLAAILAVTACLASATLALPPGYTTGTCEAVPNGEMFVQLFTPEEVDAYTPLVTYGALESASVGRFLLTPSADVAPDTIIHIARKNSTSRAYEEYSEQPSLQIMFGDECEYIAFGDAGVGVCSGGNSVKFLYYNSTTDRFESSRSGFIDTTKDFSRCFVKGERAFVYDKNASEFVVYRHVGSGLFMTETDAIPAITDAMAISRVSPELAVVSSASTITLYYLSGSVVPISTINTIAPTDYTAALITDMVFDHVDGLVVGISSTSGIYLHPRSAVGTLSSPVGQTFPFSGTGQGYRLTTSDGRGQSASFISSTAPDQLAYNNFTLGSVVVFRSPAPYLPYDAWISYFSEFSGTGATSNHVGRAADAQLGFFNNPFMTGLTWPNHDDGSVAILCYENIDCDGSCGEQCDLDDSPCTREVWDGQACVPMGVADVDDGNPCTEDICDPMLGDMHLPITSASEACTAIIDGALWGGTCLAGGCDHQFRMCFP